jgi:hypothetical protein
MTGCVATAGAQVMRFWQYPNWYAWGSMDADGSPAAAQLISDVGWLSNMNYGAWASTTNINDLQNALKAYGYSYVIQQSTAGMANPIASYLGNQLYAGRPVIARGKPAGGGTGHAWVIEGVQKKNYKYGACNPSYMLYMNWGWGGWQNGWYNQASWGTYAYDTSILMVAP